jgi:hypothetical protein
MPKPIMRRNDDEGRIGAQYAFDCYWFATRLLLDRFSTTTQP